MLKGLVSVASIVALVVGDVNIGREGRGRGRFDESMLKRREDRRPVGERIAERFEKLGIERQDEHSLRAGFERLAEARQQVQEIIDAHGELSNIDTRANEDVTGEFFERRERRLDQFNARELGDRDEKRGERGDKHRHRRQKDEDHHRELELDERGEVKHGKHRRARAKNGEELETGEERKARRAEKREPERRTQDRKRGAGKRQRQTSAPKRAMKEHDEEWLHMLEEGPELPPLRRYRAKREARAERRQERMRKFKEEHENAYGFKDVRKIQESLDAMEDEVEERVARVSEEMLKQPGGETVQFDGKTRDELLTERLAKVDNRRAAKVERTRRDADKQRKQAKKARVNREKQKQAMRSS
jgi:hypothetical protein